MNRRDFLATACAVAGAPACLAAPPRSRMGICTTSFGALRPRDTYEYLEYCHSLGAAGIQSTLTSLEPAYLEKLASRAKEWGMYIEAMFPLPKDDSGLFAQQVAAAKRVGALCIRTACLSGRRYETFPTLEDWQQFVATSKASIARAIPVMEREKMPLALENHKDWTVDEFSELLKAHHSDYVGVCLDMGNNLALLDDPMELVERLAPYAFSTHIKNMGVQESPEGFLLSEVLPADGMLDLQRMMDTVAKARPETKLTLEMITRDPLSVPCLTDKYWATFPNRSGITLGRTLRLVRARKSDKLPVVTGLDAAARLKLEEDNVKQWLNAI